MIPTIDASCFAWSGLTGLIFASDLENLLQTPGFLPRKFDVNGKNFMISFVRSFTISAYGDVTKIIYEPISFHMNLEIVVLND